jgi:NAD(P)-dependent dehydrogenase (short-subunit alcohol dehydrogenase family)
MARLAGKVAVITGAGAGIGKAAAGLFAREGASVVVSDIDTKVGEAAVAEIEAAGGTAVFAAADVSLSADVQRVVQTATEHFGKLDIMYNNAGGTRANDGPVTEASDEEFWLTMQRDLFGTWLGCKFAIPEMMRAGGGSVINASSLVALMGRPGRDAYTAAKGAISALTRSVAVRYAPQKIRVNAIAPGITRTERLARRIDQGVIPQYLIDRHILGLLEPIDIANAALFLASDESRMITGQVLAVDSGITIT